MLYHYLPISARSFFIDYTTHVYLSLFLAHQERNSLFDCTLVPFVCHRFGFSRFAAVVFFSQGLWQTQDVL